MKKIMIMVLVVSSYCFSQTGILTEKGRSAMGLWGGVSRQIDCSSCQPAYAVGFDYIMDFGLEVEVALGLTVVEDIFVWGDEYDLATKGVGLAYHLKGDVNNIAFGVAKMNAELDGNLGTIDYETDTFGVAFYNNNGFLFQVQKIRIPDLDSDYELLTFGNYWKGQTASWGITYSASWDLFDALIEDGDLEYLKYGTIGVVVGGVF